MQESVLRALYGPCQLGGKRLPACTTERVELKGKCLIMRRRRTAREREEGGELGEERASHKTKLRPMPWATKIIADVAMPAGNENEHKDNVLGSDACLHKTAARGGHECKPQTVACREQHEWPRAAPVPHKPATSASPGGARPEAPAAPAPRQQRSTLRRSSASKSLQVIQPLGGPLPQTSS